MHGDRIYITTAAVLVLQAATLMDALKSTPSSSSSPSIGSQKLPIFDKVRSGCCSCQNCCPCIPTFPGPLDGPGIGGVGGGGGGIGPANIENVDYAIDAHTVAPVSDSIGTRLFGGSLFNRLGTSRRSVVLRRRTFRPNGVTLVELEEPGPYYGGGGFLTRFWPFALENGNNTRTKHVDVVKDIRDEYPEHRDEERGFMSISPKRPKALLRRG